MEKEKIIRYLYDIMYKLMMKNIEDEWYYERSDIEQMIEDLIDKI